MGPYPLLHDNEARSERCPSGHTNADNFARTHRLWVKNEERVMPLPAHPGGKAGSIASGFGSGSQSIGSHSTVGDNALKRSGRTLPPIYIKNPRPWASVTIS